METNIEKLLEFLLQEQAIGPSKAYRWKESVMQAIQDALYARADMINSQEQLEKAVDEEVQKIREDLDLTLSMIGRTLYQVPFQVFKMPKSSSEK